MLIDGFERIGPSLHATVDDLSEEQLTARVTLDANTIAWLTWHLTRVQDDHVADVAGTEQVWTAGGWSERFGLPFEPDATGYGHSPDEVAAVREVDAKLLGDYFDAVSEETGRFLRGLAEEDLDRVVDDQWDPPVTLGARLVSVLTDDLQHVGQAAFIRGLL